MFGALSTPSTIQALIIALDDPNFMIGNQARFTEADLTAYVASRILAQNQKMVGLIDIFCSTTGSRDWVNWTGQNALKFHRKSEGARPPLQSTSVSPQIMGAPLVAWEAAFGWTEETLRMMSGPDFKIQVDGIAEGDTKNVTAQILKRLLDPTTETFNDYRFDNRELTCYGLANGDTWKYNFGVHGKVIADTHDHYRAIAGASLATGDLDDLITDVREHGVNRVRLICNPDDSSDFDGLTGFYAKQVKDVVPSQNAAHLDPSVGVLTQDDENADGLVFIGRYKDVPVYTLWWWEAGYIICDPMETPKEGKPLKVRTFNGGYTMGSALAMLGNYTNSSGIMRPNLGDLRVFGPEGMDNFNIYGVRRSEREIGVGAGNRVGAAILSLTAGGSYVIPDIDAA